MVTVMVMNDPLPPLCSMALGPPIMRSSYFKIWPWKSLVITMHMDRDVGHIWLWKFKDQGHCQGHKHICHIWGLEFIQCVCFLFCGNSKFSIWPWKFKVKLMAKAKPDGHIWGLNLNCYVCFLFHGNRTILSWDIANCIFDLEKIKVKVTAKVKADGHIWGLEFNRYVCFLFRCIRTIFGWDIANSMCDLENSRSKSWPRSNPMATSEA